MMKHKFIPVDADCPRHHCLYGEMQADGKSGKSDFIVFYIYFGRVQTITWEYNFR